MTQAKVAVAPEGGAAPDESWPVCGAIGPGFLVLIGVTHGDTPQDCVTLAERLAHLRVFADEEGKMNLSLRDVGGEVLLVSQFTLYADCRRGRRPSFTAAAPPEEARALVQEFARQLEKSGLRVAQGRFGAHMRIDLTNDGPVTIMLESRDGVLV